MTSATLLMERILGSFILTLLFFSLTPGQGSSGIIICTVFDVKGVRIPGAKVTVANPKTGVKKKDTTKDDGYFKIIGLSPGVYTILVEKESYDSFQKIVPLETMRVVNPKPINIKPNSGATKSTDDAELRAEINIVLILDSQTQNSGPQDSTLGDSGSFAPIVAQSQQAAGKGSSASPQNKNEPLIPDAGRLQVYSLSGERSDLISNNQVLNLALNGRDIIEFMKLMPGVVSDFNGQVSNSGGLNRFFINGTRGNQHELAIDGVSNVDTGTNGARHVTINPDAVDEVKVLTANYQAEYGKAAGGFIQIVTKSGTAEFHGGGRYFHRHEGLNANGFFENTNHRPRSLYRYNSFGYDIGGPVYLPRFGEGGPLFKPIKSLFFYVNQEFYQQLFPTPLRSIRVPTAKEREGDFSETKDFLGGQLSLKGPCGNDPTVRDFSSNIIPSSCFFRDGQAILKLYPLPNVPSAGAGNLPNYVAQSSTKYPRRETIARFDYKPSESMDVTIRVIHNSDEQSLPFGNADNLNLVNTALLLRRTDPNAQNFDKWKIIFPRPGINVAFTLTQSFGSSMTNEFIFGLSRSRSTLAPEAGTATRAANNISFPLLFPAANTGDLIPNFDFGQFSSSLPVSTRGPKTAFDGLPFNGSNQTLNFANNLTKVLKAHLVKVGVFFQQSRRTQTTSGPNNADITFTSTSPSNYAFANGLLGYFDRYVQTEKLLTGHYRYRNVEGYIQDLWRVNDRLALDLGLRVSWYQPQYDAQLQASFFDPKLFDPNSKAQLNSSGNILPTKANLDRLNIGFGLAGQNYERGGIKTRGAQLGPRLGFAYDLFGNGRTVLRGGFGAFFDRVQGGIISDMLRNPPFSGVERTLPAGYLGNLDKSQALIFPPTVYGIARDGKIPTVYSYSLNLQRDIGWETVVDVAYVGTQGRHLTQVRDLNAVPYGMTFLPENSAKATDFLRPYQGLGEIRYYEFGGSSNYNSLQVSARRRFSRNLTLSAAYTFSRAFNTTSEDMELTSSFDVRDRDYRLAAFDRTHVFAASYVYSLPHISDYLGKNKLVKAVFDDWQLSGITQFSSGQPFEVANLSTGVGQQITGSPTELLRVYLRSGVDPRQGLDGVQINPLAFVPPKPGQTDPAPRNYLRGPGVNNWDISVFKNIPLAADGRLLQLRLEMFNAFNHTQFSSINFRSIGDGYNGGDPNISFTTRQGIYVIRLSGPILPRTELTKEQKLLPLGQLFGDYNSARLPRIIQLAAKFYF